MDFFKFSIYFVAMNSKRNRLQPKKFVFAFIMVLGSDNWYVQ